MVVEYEDCAPFLSALIMEVVGEPAPSIGAICKAVTDGVRQLSDFGPIVSRKVAKVPDPIFEHGGAQVGWLHYSETRRPAWYQGNELTEERQHAVFIMLRGTIAALTFTDPAMRNSVAVAVRRAKEGALHKLRLLPQKHVRDAFVGNGVRTIWLSGAHRRMTTKADSKVLSGIELESALDPLEDQTYYFSSVRSQVAMLHAGGEGSPIVGANPRNARVWLGPTADWADFAARSEALIDAAALAIANPPTVASSLSLLAQPMDTVPNARAPYDMVVFFPEAAPAGNENEDEQWLHEFSDAARFELEAIPDSPSFFATVFWGDVRYGQLHYEFVAGEAVDLSVKIVDWNEDEEHANKILRFCRNPELLTVYYDTGHTFARGMFYETKFRDAFFEGWKWADMSDIDVHREKPLDNRTLLVDDIGGPNDRSLFGFVARHWPNYGDQGAPAGWLVCDDGSMESADFIHFDNSGERPALTLIHVKGSSSDANNRGLSVTDYEVVVGQAVKNLRYLDRGHIAEKLAGNKDNVIGSAVWYNGERRPNRDDVIVALNAAGSNMSKTMVVLQSRVRKSDHQAIRQLITNGMVNDRVRRLQQLDALPLAPRAECYGLGADFVVIGDEDFIP